MAARTETLRRLGPFDPGQFLFYEDIDLCLRARAAGIPTVFEPAVRSATSAATRPGRVYDGEPHDLLARRRREVVARQPRLAPRSRSTTLAQALTFATRAAGRLVLGRDADRERAQLARRACAHGHNDAVSIRQLKASDRDAFLEMVHSSRDLHRPWAYPPERADQFDELLSRCARDDFACFIVIDDDTATSRASSTSPRSCAARSSPPSSATTARARHAGKGLMRAGLQQVLDYAFGPLSLHRIEANIQPGNAASIALARGAGFRLEGYSPRYLLIGGQWRDHERYALTVDERRIRTARS